MLQQRRQPRVSVALALGDGPQLTSLADNSIFVIIANRLAIQGADRVCAAIWHSEFLEVVGL